jgi:hypothetical protein
MAFTNRKKIDMVLIYGEARGHSELAQCFLNGPNARTIVNVGQHLRDFEHFEMNKCDFGRQQDCILVTEEDIPHQIQERHFQQSFSYVVGLLKILS